MGVALLAWGRFFAPYREGVTVPASVDKAGIAWLLYLLPRHARNRGFTALQWPSKADDGAAFSTDLTYLALQTF
ncbi:hypothetical protein IVB46_28700 [Bradyrhizobium sp. 61]|uniref:hypothetical protein n=1 Tax=unclassified Bradyrhizobium TaxID=2631580 RepID=UPI001FF88C25|nr:MULTISPECIES: hypothetical protein [unclassified Bradyrhizobium]MCK1279210.1 hypothetical protein [Bradyrhizobium sp. 61]MCK1447181.1 hypothetical protein [Bradyrhizobium sp. 48]MCK1464347.1 hypothetical protein [Bradyrhizobium sp. 2]